MSVTLRLPWLRLFPLFGSLVTFHPVPLFAAMRTRSMERQVEEALSPMPPHLRKDAGLPPLAPREPEHPAMTRARSRGRNWAEP